jgi:hypothetical protein
MTKDPYEQDRVMAPLAPLILLIWVVMFVGGGILGLIYMVTG